MNLIQCYVLDFAISFFRNLGKFSVRIKIRFKEMYEINSPKIGC